MADLSIIDTTLSSVLAAPATLEVLRDLHTKALAEPPYLSADDQPQTAALDRFVALDPEKCALVYLLLRSIGARYVVEAGTSFGLSTIYLALAVGQNAKAQGADGRVIATENEPTKAARARDHWKRAGKDVEDWIELREGDIRETLKTDYPGQIDFLLLDIWCFLALPTMELVKPHLRVGAMVVMDNVTASSDGYKNLLAYLDNPANGFKRTTAPYQGGLEIAVYLGRGDA
ncbi:O-methyltransferase MdmC [Madurella mycetomatis]|uniref:O-methyltransferase MdmC n=1 Tax=Madurella mycetomatis TaxID=100816 RepID=A0A175W6L1_9PEZI|nr:O-methyltransferase MdmC [Madurella mycetomatis]